MTASKSNLLLSSCVEKKSQKNNQQWQWWIAKETRAEHWNGEEFVFFKVCTVAAFYIYTSAGYGECISKVLYKVSD